VESADPDVMVYRTGGGCLALFGLPFLLAGLFVMFLPLFPGKTKPEGGSSKQMPAALAIPFGAIFAAVGAAFVFGRAGKTIDRRSGTMTTWWGIVVPFRRKEYPLSAFDRVTLSREVRRSKNSTYTVYPVRLEGPGAKKAALEERRAQRAARQGGEELAKFLGLKLADRSMGTLIVREAEELDESIRERARRRGERLEVSEPPPERRSRQSVAGDTLCFEIPPAGFRRAHLVGVAFGVVLGIVVPVVVYFVFLRNILGDEKMPVGVKAILVVFLVVFFMLVPLLAGLAITLRGFARRSVVEVSPRELRVTQHGLLRARSKVIPTDELEELEIVGPSALEGMASLHAFLGGEKVIVARSDRASAAFGAGLSPAELEWMQAVIWNVVSA